MRSIRALALVLFLSKVVWAVGPSDPVGEWAQYHVDKDPKRTSSFIKSGSFFAKVTGFVDPSAGGPAYDIQIDYQFDAGIMGSHDGTEVAQIDEAYFLPEFMANLKATGVYEGPKFKAKYLGVSDAKTLDGHFYPQCDVVLLYDFKETYSGYLAEFENLQIVVHVTSQLPVLGAAKLDISGKYSGISVKAGGDYETPNRR